MKLHLPECIAHYLLNDVIKRMIYSQSTLHFSGFLIDVQSYLVKSV